MTELADKLVLAYRRIRDAKAKLEEQHAQALEQLDAQLATVEQELLKICAETGQTGGKTEHGTFTRTVKTRYWTNNWPAMHKMIVEQNAPQLLEQRIHQGNFKQFIAEHPEFMPEGLNVDSKYGITVRKPTSKPTN